MKKLSPYLAFLAAVCTTAITTSPALSQKVVRRTQICIDTKKEKIVLRRNCRTPRFTEITPADIQRAPELQVISESFEISLNNGDISGRSISCPDGLYATGGGASIIENNGLLLKTTIPGSKANGWSATAEGRRNGASGVLNIYAVCATNVSLKLDVE